MLSTPCTLSVAGILFVFFGVALIGVCSTDLFAQFNQWWCSLPGGLSLFRGNPDEFETRVGLLACITAYTWKPCFLTQSGQIYNMYYT